MARVQPVSTTESGSPLQRRPLVRLKLSALGISAKVPSSLGSLADYVPHHSPCKGSDALKSHVLPAGLFSPGRNSARLASKLIDAPFSFHVMSSALSRWLSSVDSKETPRWRTISPSTDPIPPSARPAS